ncbi:MAG: hypothetical protein JWN44_6112 [Myxococcales bacterium]|nr:hypothetical protein [Myxococcales bacterium]
MRAVTLAIVILVAAGVAGGCGGWSAKRAVLRANLELYDGIRGRDAGKLRNVLAADFRWHAPDGKSRTRDEWISGIEATPGQMLSVTGLRLTTEMRGARITLCGVQRAVLKLDGKDLIDDGPFCDDWERRDGRWQIVEAYVPTF